MRFSGFLVLLSRFVIGGQGVIPARGWIQGERVGLDSGRQRGIEAESHIAPTGPDNQLDGTLAS